MTNVHVLPSDYLEADVTLDGAAPDYLVTELGIHEPLLSFPSGYDEGADWTAALDAMIAARLFQGG